MGEFSLICLLNHWRNGGLNLSGIFDIWDYWTQMKPNWRTESITENTRNWNSCSHLHEAFTLCIQYGMWGSMGARRNFILERSRICSSGLNNTYLVPATIGSRLLELTSAFLHSIGFIWTSKDLVTYLWSDCLPGLAMT